VILNDQKQLHFVYWRPESDRIWNEMKRLAFYWLRQVTWHIRPPNQIQKALFALVALWLTVASVTVALWNWTMTSSTATVAVSDLNPGIITTGRRRHVIGKSPDIHAGLGNEMFIYSSILGIAEINHMIPIVRSKQLPELFDVKGWSMVSFYHTPMFFHCALPNLHSSSRFTLCCAGSSVIM
jgi:hypothetical protein